MDISFESHSVKRKAQHPARFKTTTVFSKAWAANASHSQTELFLAFVSTDTEMHFRQTMPTPMQAGAKNKGNFKIVLRCFDWRRRRRCRWRRRFVSLLSRNFWAAFCNSKWQRCQKILLARRPKIQIKSWAEWKAFTSPLTSPLIFLITEFLSLKYLNTFIQLLHWHRGKSFRKSWMICGLLNSGDRPSQPVVKQSNPNF